MGFLTRSRVERGCLIRGNRICKKGVQYRYRLSSQGMKYVDWLKNRKTIEDFAYAKLTSEVLSHLPDELKDRLSMLSLAKSASKYKGPSRNTNLLESNVVPVVCLSTERMRLRSEKEKLELENAIQKVKLTDLQQTINNYKKQNTSLNNALARTLFWAAAHKNSADYWERQFEQIYRRLAKLLGPLEALPTLSRDEGNDANTPNPINRMDAPSFDPRTGISHIPGVIKRIGTPVSLIIPWREHYGTYVVAELTPQGPGRILTTYQINPESLRTAFETPTNKESVGFSPSG
jgi:hypothetical protein